MNSELFGSGLLTSDGDLWRRQRRLSSPAFHRESIVRYAEITVEEAVRMLTGWKQGNARNIHNDMMNVTLLVALRSLFGGELGVRTRMIEQALDVVMRGSSGIHVVTGYLHIPTLTQTRYLRAVRQLENDSFRVDSARTGKDQKRCGRRRQRFAYAPSRGPRRRRHYDDGPAASRRGDNTITRRA